MAGAEQIVTTRTRDHLRIHVGRSHTIMVRCRDTVELEPQSLAGACSECNTRCARPDRIIRFGGDEHLCGMLNAPVNSPARAVRRISARRSRSEGTSWPTTEPFLRLRGIRVIP
jgi:hypothetical protein